MPRLTIRVEGLQDVRARLQSMRARLPEVVLGAAQQISNDTAVALSEAAPTGQGGGGTPPGTDAEGPLKESFVVETDGDASAFTVAVLTTQPTKLRYVREGRGQVLPLRPAFALMWNGLDHPVARAGPSTANDFATPVLQAALDGAEVALQTALTTLLKE